MRDDDLILSAMKAAAWERAKGALRELVALRGSVRSDHPDPGAYELTSRAVEAFVEEIENEGLYD